MYSNIELFEVLKRPMAGAEEIMILADCKRQKACEIRQEIEKEILDSGKKLPPYSKRVPMERLIKFLGINENRIIKMAQIEVNMKKADMGNVDKTKI